MTKKNTPPINFMPGIILVLTAVLFWPNHSLKSIGASSHDHLSRPNNLFELMAGMMGWGGFNASSNGTSQGNTLANQQGLSNGQAGGSNSANQRNQNLLGPNGSSLLGAGAAGQQNNDDTNPLGLNAEGSGDNNTTNNSEINSSNGPGNNSANNPSTNSENNPDNSGNNPADNSDAGDQNNSDNNSGNNPVGNSEETSSSNSGDNGSGNSGNSSGSSSGGNSGSNSGGSSNLINLPTINPIPSDGSVSQSVGQLNQQNDSLAAALAARQALVAPVQLQAQSTKYQTVDPGTLQPVSTNQVPADVVQKVKANQVAITH